LCARGRRESADHHDDKHDDKYDDKYVDQYDVDHEYPVADDDSSDSDDPD